jgi:3-hydroxyethyl bacteriochlorophyllide a dehydrogenase
MHTQAIVFHAPEQLSVTRVGLVEPGAADVLVGVEWSGISTGTERLIWSGRMPPFPGMGYPLVPGYEAVGRVLAAGSEAGVAMGEHVFVPGSRGFADVRGLFGASAGHLVAQGSRVIPISERHGPDAVLLALAATALHALDAGPPPGLIVGHGVLGRLLARLCLARGFQPPVVWERNPARLSGAAGYAVLQPEADERRDYAAICDVSGDADILDTLVQRLAPGGEISLAGFYDSRVSFAFPPAFMKEARLRIAAEWRPADMQGVKALLDAGRLSLAGLITHQASFRDAGAAYRAAFDEPACLKMVLDWRGCP